MAALKARSDGPASRHRTTNRGVPAKDPDTPPGRIAISLGRAAPGPAESDVHATIDDVSASSAASRLPDDSQGLCQRSVCVCLRPLAAGDEAELRRIHASAEVARWWGLPDERFPWEEPESTRLTIVVDGAIAGLIEFHEELEPRYRHAAIDLFLDPALHGRGIGTEAVQMLVRRLIHDRGHHRITIDPATANTAAIRAYAKAGFKPVGVMHQAERDPTSEAWRDSLLMELIASERV